MKTCPHCHITYFEGNFCPNCSAKANLSTFLHELKEDLGTSFRSISAASKNLDVLQKKILDFESALEAIQEQKEPERPSSAPSTTSTSTPPIQSIASTGTTASHAPKPSLLHGDEWESDDKTLKPKDRRYSEITLGQKWLLVIGVIVTLFGVGYFLKYSFEKNWVGPAGRVASALFMGFIFLMIGEITRKKNFESFGFNLIGAGIAVFYLSTFAAFQIYQLLIQEAALGLMILITVFAGSLSLFYNKKGLAVLGLVGGFATPLLLSTGTSNLLVLMTYLTILNLGVLWISFFKRWSVLNQLGHAFTWLLFSGYYFQHYQRDMFWSTLLFANLFFVIYAFVPFLYYFMKPQSKIRSGFFISIPNAFFGFFYSYQLIQREFSFYEISAISVAYALLYFFMSYTLLRRVPQNLQCIAILLGKAILFLFLTVPLLVSHHWISVFWMMEAVALLWVAFKTKSIWLLRGTVLATVLVLGKFFCWDWPVIFHVLSNGIYFHIYEPYFDLSLERWTTHLTILFSLIAMARIAAKNKYSGICRPSRGSAILAALAAVVAFFIFNLEVGAYFREFLPEARFAAISVLWTVFSVITMIIGFTRNQGSLRKFAMCLFAVTLFKVFLFDMHYVSTPFRILSFIVLGLVLIAASFLYHRYRDKILPREGKTSL